MIRIRENSKAKRYAAQWVGGQRYCAGLSLVGTSSLMNLHQVIIVDPKESVP